MTVLYERDKIGLLLTLICHEPPVKQAYEERAGHWQYQVQDNTNLAPMESKVDVEK